MGYKVFRISVFYFGIIHFVWFGVCKPLVRNKIWTCFIPDMLHSMFYLTVDGLRFLH